MTEIFKHESYVTHRNPVILHDWVQQQITNLKNRRPDKSLEEIEAFVRRVAKDRFVDPIADVLVHPTPGNTVRQEIPLSQLYTRHIKQNIITPSGTTYMLPTQKESFLKVSLATKLKERKVYKKIYLDALEKGDLVTANNNNLLQATTKIFANSAPGAMNSPFNVLYDLPGYNGITSTARQSVKYGYAHTERMVEANLFLPTIDDVVSFCVRMQMVAPANMMDIVRQYGIYIPTVDDVTDYLNSGHAYYTAHDERHLVRKAVESITVEGRVFAMYAACLRNLLQYNDHIFKPFLNGLFDKDAPVTDSSVEPKSVFNIEEGLLAMVTSLNYESLGRDEKGEWFNVVDALKGNPDGVRRIIAIAKYMEEKLQKIGPLLSTFMRTEADIAKLGAHQDMIRRCVVISDTDSVIFTTQNLVKWYTGKFGFSKESYDINAFTVYVLTQSLEHIFARLSCGFGMIGDDIKKIAMKNEFLYPIIMRTSIRKHYAGIVTFQEGKYLSKPKRDIKGLQFRSSTLSSFTNNAVQEYLVGTLNAIIDKGVVTTADVLGPVAEFETKLYRSLMAGEKEFLQTVSVKPATEYANPSISSYFYYEMWQEVFVPKFDGIILPNKCYKLPLIAGGNILKSEKFLNSLREFDEGVYQRFLAFLEKHPKKNITQILVPPSLQVIPEILRQVIDTRSIIFSNASPFYLGLSSLGFAYGYGKDSYIVSDFYNPHEISVPLL